MLNASVREHVSSPLTTFAEWRIFLAQLIQEDAFWGAALKQANFTGDDGKVVTLSFSSDLLLFGRLSTPAGAKELEAAFLRIMQKKRRIALSVGSQASHGEVTSVAASERREDADRLKAFQAELMRDEAIDLLVREFQIKLEHIELLKEESHERTPAP